MTMINWTENITYSVFLSLLFSSIYFPDFIPKIAKANSYPALSYESYHQGVKGFLLFICFLLLLPPFEASQPHLFKLLLMQCHEAAKYTQYLLSSPYCIELTVNDWLASLWLIKERQYAILLTQRARPIFITWFVWILTILKGWIIFL